MKKALLILALLFFLSQTVFCQANKEKPGKQVAVKRIVTVQKKPKGLWRNLKRVLIFPVKVAVWVFLEGKVK